MKIEGCVALVTGAASGIGKAVCERLLEAGCKVVLVDINENKSEELIKKFNGEYGKDQTMFLPCDVSNQDQLEGIFTTTISKYGRLDIVCNNAGIIDEKNWMRTLDINLKAVIHGTLLAMEHMLSGVIINTSSTGGLHPASFCPVYCGSKFGVVGFTRSIAPVAFRKKGIRVNCICPGGTDTAIYESFEQLELTQEQKDLKEKVGKQTPVFVAKCFMDLIKDDNDNGQVLKVTYENGAEYIDYHDTVI
ncbi:15-hydroxyprostaglandin dehydrogenase [NAD(+)] isoform X2 [Exaiptasia diaphana]|nr:15-hydroxyprostaglandin dehydrogenase [NAD(+)] isoform X2 [Exaiptasia diaphana]XP_020892935.1 15-hydroxyprostaglandin dehydrogenase [NAD(+)] isoform X2 [Exaiptasia diaphana]KXJ18506.1 15-hydroxyprostaglandin dehydrogenase [NAD(+)] [Exaiptasia diaphana]